MTAVTATTLIEQQVLLTRALLELRFGMAQLLVSRVMPHLDSRARGVVRDLIEALDEEDAIDPNFAIYVDTARAEVRAAIAAGTREEKVPIPRDGLIGCSEAFDTRTVVSPAAEELRTALPPLDALYGAARRALDFAEAIRLSLRLLNLD